MREKLKKFINKYGWKNLCILLIYPVLLPFFTCLALTKTIKNILTELRKGNWRYLNGNNFHMAMLNYCYYIEDFNIQKFGRYGKSDLLAGGNYDLKNWFHITPLSLRLMSSLGTAMMLFIAMFVWIFSFVLLIDSWNLFTAGIIFFSVASTLFYIIFVDIQNYNIVGWMFLPLAINSLLSQNYLTFSILTIAMSFASFTSIYVISWFVLVSSLYTMSLMPLIALIPAIIKISIPVITSMQCKSLQKMSALIGLYKATKYKRNNIRLSFANYYISILWLLFPSVYFIFYGFNEMFLFTVIPVILYVMNQRISRFADSQTFYIVFLSIAALALLKSEANIYLLGAFILSINPIYGLIGIKPHGRYFFNPAVRKPINSKNIEKCIEKFLDKLKPKSKVLLSFKNPNNNYNNIFDGYRNFIEPLEFVANKHDIIIFPDWWYVFENNRSDSPEDFWANEPESVKNALFTYNANYVIVYNNIEEFDNKWNKDFDKISLLKWNKLIEELDVDYEKKELYWWLLKVKE